jgi:hypothetical protein
LPAQGVKAAADARLRQCRSGPAEDRRRDRRAVEEMGLLSRLGRPRAPSLDNARQDDHRPRAGRHEPGLIGVFGSYVKSTDIELIWTATTSSAGRLVVKAALGAVLPSTPRKCDRGWRENSPLTRRPKYKRAPGKLGAPLFVPEIRMLFCQPLFGWRASRRASPR